MKLDLCRPDFAIRSSKQNLDWSSSSDLKEKQWVKLLELPNPYSFEEALLLCQVDQNAWLAWIPDHGEALLHSSQFCQDCY